MTVLISLLSLAAMVLAICCTVLFAIAAAIELLPAPPAQPRDEGRYLVGVRKEEIAIDAQEAHR